MFFQEPPPPPPEPSAWVREIERDEPVAELPEVVVTGVLGDRPLPPPSCLLIIPGYKGDNAVLSFTVSEDLFRNCTWRLQEDDRRHSLDDETRIEVWNIYTRRF